jgi:hypothetical protein
MRLARSAGLAAVLGACLLIPAAATGFNGTVLRGLGTATIDGVAAPGEWNPAGAVNFSVRRAAQHGGGTVPATVYAMNDATNLYIALKVDNATVAASTAEISFDGDHDDNAFEDGEDRIAVDSLGFFHDRFYRQGSDAYDIDHSGTNDGDERDGDGPGYSFYEFSHPLDSADNAHDFSLRAGMRIGFRLRFRHCATAASCAPTSTYPEFQFAEIVIVSGSRIPPDTQFTGGPREGSWVGSLTQTFEFTGSDDAVQPTQLTFECKLDQEEWRACTSPVEIADDDGRHTLSVRASDEMLNVDSTPAVRNWIVDTTDPSKPVIRGRRSVRSGQKVVLRFSATDALTPASQLRFRCSVDARGMRPCPRVYRVRLSPGRHQVRVRALDRLGYLSPVAKARITVLRARR